MTTAAARAEKMLIYDGDCPMCRGTIALLLRLRLLKHEQTHSNYEVQGPNLEAAQAAGLRNELVVLDPDTRETRSGSDALLWIIGDNTRDHLLVRLLGLPGPRHALRWGYQVVSYNRRIISPPRHQIVCDCEPEVTLTRRLSLIVPVLILTVLLVAAFGAALFHGAGLGTTIEGAALAIVAAGAGLLAMIVAALVLLPGERRVDYVGHAAVTMLIGALVMLPVGLVALLVPREVALGLGALSLAASLALMVRMQWRRARALSISRLWIAMWPLVVLTGVVATAWSYFGQ